MATKKKNVSQEITRAMIGKIAFARFPKLEKDHPDYMSRRDCRIAFIQGMKMREHEELKKLKKTLPKRIRQVAPKFQLIEVFNRTYKGGGSSSIQKSYGLFQMTKEWLESFNLNCKNSQSIITFGIKDGNIYKITKSEISDRFVSGLGGYRYDITPLEESNEVKAWLLFQNL